MSLPKVHEIVFAKLSYSKSGIGNYVKLVEYDNIEGLVLCTEITKYKSDLKSLIKNDEVFPLVVLSATDKGIDLSYSTQSTLFNTQLNRNQKLLVSKKRECL